MAVLPNPTRLACVKCGCTVVMIRLVDGSQSQALPCGHTGGYLSVPDYGVTPGSAA